MKAKPKQHAATPDLFRSELKSILNLRHELCRLAEIIDWSRFDNKFAEFFPSKKGCPAIASRMVAGLLYLKHAFNLSDEALVERWMENPYWQYFCGEQYLQHKFPIDPSSMTRWRKRLGEEGCESLLQEMLRVGVETKAVKVEDMKKVIIDTTVQEKAITYPTDSKLFQTARRWLVRLAKKHGLELRQSYERLGKKVLFEANCYARARQMSRSKKKTKQLKTYLGRVYRNILRQLENKEELKNYFSESLSRVSQLLKQERKSKNKLFSVHAPEVECIGKGKSHKKYEFGVKASIVTTHKSNFVIGMKTFPGNPYDGHTLKTALDQVEKLVGKRPEFCYADRGYRGHDENETKIIISRQKRFMKTRAMRQAMKRRNAIEPIIGHLKSDTRLGRNYLKGELGDRINAILSAVGHNFRIILRKLRLLWLKILCIFLQNFCFANQSYV
jgi:transposase, IS5 family